MDPFAAKRKVSTEPDQLHIYAGVMLDASHLTNTSSFERIANRLTSPDAPACYIFDIDTARSPRRPLRNGAVLSRLKELFDALDAANKYSMMVRCDLEALLLNAVSGLDAFAIDRVPRSGVRATLGGLGVSAGNYR